LTGKAVTVGLNSRKFYTLNQLTLRGFPETKQTTLFQQHIFDKTQSKRIHPRALSDAWMPPQLDRGISVPVVDSQFSVKSTLSFYQQPPNSVVHGRSPESSFKTIFIPIPLTHVEGLG
jgi:hypothetical protein